MRTHDNDTCAECGAELKRVGSAGQSLDPLCCPQCGGPVCEECLHPIGHGSFVSGPIGNQVTCADCAA